MANPGTSTDASSDAGAALRPASAPPVTEAKPDTAHTLVLLGTDDPNPPGFPLGASRLALGAGEKDDVFLTGVGVVPGHVQLVFLEGRVTLLSATAEVRVDGVPATGFPLELRPQQVLSLSPDTHLAYGEVGSRWPQPAAWAVDQAPEAEPEVPATGGVEPAATARTPAPPLSTREHLLRSARRGAFALGAAVVIISGLVASDLLWGDREMPSPGAQAIDRSEVVLLKFLASDPVAYGSVKLTVRPDGALSLTGFVESEAAYRLLAEQVRQQLVNSRGNVRLDAMTSERLAAMVSDQLTRFALGSRIEVTPTQVQLTIFGVQSDPELDERLEAELGRLAARLAPRRLELVFRLQPAEVITSEVIAALARSVTTREMQFSLDENGGRITGLVAAAAEVETRAALGELQKSFAERLPLTVDLRVDPKLNFSVVGLTLGGNESTATLLQRGKTQTFRVGEPVFGIGELLAIKGDGVMLAMGRREIFIPLIR